MEAQQTQQQSIVYSGPQMMPIQVKEYIKANLLNWENMGLSILEHSVRIPLYHQNVHKETLAKLSKILNLPQNWTLIWQQGEPSIHYCPVVKNFIPANGKIGVVKTGSTSLRAYEDFLRGFADTSIVNDWENNRNPGVVPDLRQGSINLNNFDLIFYVDSERDSGVEFTCGRTPKRNARKNGYLVMSDISQSLLTKEIDYLNQDIIIANACPNLSTEGGSIILVRNELLEAEPAQNLFMMSNLRTIHKAESALNTTNSHVVWSAGIFLDFMRSSGITPLKIRNLAAARATAIYDIIDASRGFYFTLAERSYRSKANIVLTCENKFLNRQFATFAAEKGIQNVLDSEGNISFYLPILTPLTVARKISNSLYHFYRLNSQKL